MTDLRKPQDSQGENEAVVELPGATFRRQLRETRRRVGLSQEELAERIKVRGGDLHATAITRIERGDRKVSLEEVLLISAALGVAPIYLVVPRGTEMVRLAEEDENVYDPLRIRDWIRGETWLDQELAGGAFWNERPYQERMLQQDEYLVFRLCTLLTRRIRDDILAAGDPRGGPNWLGEFADSYFTEIEERLEQVNAEVRRYVSTRRQQEHVDAEHR